MTSTHKPIFEKYPPLAILGLPNNNFELAALVSECLTKIKKNKAESRVSYLSAIDAPLAAKCYGWLPTTIDNPELLSIIRNTDLSYMPEGFLRKLGKALGASAAPPFTTADFLLSLCKALGENEKGIFILGGFENETKSAAIKLHDNFNRLRLVGIATPPVYTQDEDLINANERDAILAEQINSSNADVLFVNLGSSKQWIWLERVRHLLEVPLVITTDHYLQHLWKDKTSSKDLQESEKPGFDGSAPPTSPPKSKWKSLFTSLKLSWMAAPLVFYHTISRYLYKWFYKNKVENKDFNSQLFISSDRTLVVIGLPESLDSSNLEQLKQKLEDATSHDVLVFDFKNVRHIQPEGFYQLIKTWLQRKGQNREVYGFSPSTDIEWLMKLHRTWDIFKNTLCDSAEVFLSRLADKRGATFYDAFTQNNSLVTISLLGSLDNNIDFEAYMKKIIPVIGQKNCCIDFSYCTYIDNTGFIFLINLRKHLDSLRHDLVLTSVNKQLMKQFRSSLLDKSFTFKQ